MTYLTGESSVVHDWTKIDFVNFVYNSFQFNGVLGGPTLVVNGSTILKIVGVNMQCIIDENTTSIDEDLILLGNPKTKFTGSLSDVASDTYISKYSFNFDSTLLDNLEGSDSGAGAIGNLLGSLSISLWTKHDHTATLPQDGYIFDRADSPTSQGYSMLLDGFSSGEWAFYIGTNGGTRRVRATTPVTVPEDVWFHIVGTWNTDTKSQKIYINGELINENLLPGETIQSCTQKTVMGCKTPVATNPYHGIINNISLWDKELTQSEIDEIFNSGEPNNLDLHSAKNNGVSWWKMGDGATWDGTSWRVEDLWGGTHVVSANMLYANRVTDTPE